MNFIKPSWPAPAHVKAYATLRTTGHSQAPFDSFNLAEHVGDEKAAVAANRALLKSKLALPAEPVWLEQTHSTIVLPALSENRGKEADASFTTTPRQVCVVLTADCLPILLCDKAGTQVAAIHAGWRGLAHGIIENTLAAMQMHAAADMMAWLAPAIGASVYEVGDEVRQVFLAQDQEAELAFAPSPNKRWLADLYLLARQRLQKFGVKQIFGGEHCTFSDSASFYSYRRDGQATGRMASLIYLDLDAG